MATSEIAMDATVQIGHVIDVRGAWPRGTLALYDLALVFEENGGGEPVALALTDIRQVSFLANAVTDEFRIRTFGGPSWAIRVCSGLELVVALRLRGVVVPEKRG